MNCRAGMVEKRTKKIRANLHYLWIMKTTLIRKNNESTSRFCGGLRTILKTTSSTPKAPITNVVLIGQKMNYERSIFIEQIKNADLLSSGKPNKQVIANMSIADIRDFAEQSAELTSAKNLPRESSLFSHCASLSLSGGRHPCNSINCRKERTENLLQFSAFYSDKIYTHNFFSNYIRHYDESEQDLDEANLQKNFAEDLSIISDMIPCIEAGYITPITPPNFCPSCLAIQLVLGEEDDRKLKRARNRLTLDFNKNIKVTIQRKNNGYYIIAKGPNSLLDHGFEAHIIPNLPSSLIAIPHIFKKIESGKVVDISRLAFKKTEFDRALTARVYESILFEMAAAQCLDTSFLSDTQVEIDFIQGLKPQLSHSPVSSIEQNLKTIVPFLGNLSAPEILRLREGEREHFILFRQALNKAISEYVKVNGSFSKNDAKHLHYDVIEPALAKLDLKIKNAQRIILKGTGRRAIAWTGAISAGVYAGLLPNSLVAAAGALGLTKILADLLKDLLAHGDAQDVIRHDEMYFLWQVQRKAKRNKRKK